MQWAQHGRQDDDLGRGDLGRGDLGWGGADDGADVIEAWIARGRMKEMQAKGWRALGPIRDDAVWMRGPDPDDPDAGDGSPGTWKRLAVPAAAALRRPHGRRVA